MFREPLLVLVDPDIHTQSDRVRQLIGRDVFTALHLQLKIFWRCKAS